MAAWVAVRASRVLHKQRDSNFGLVEQPDRVNRWTIVETEVRQLLDEYHDPVYSITWISLKFIFESVTGNSPKIN